MTSICKGRLDVEKKVPNVFDKATTLIKEDTCMKVSDETRALTLGDRCIWSRSTGKTTANQTQNELSMRCSVQTHPETNSLPAKSYPGQREDTATLREKHWEYYMD